MFAKVSCFLLFAALVSTGLAFPKADHDDESSEKHHHHLTEDEGHDQHHHHGGKEHKHKKGDEHHHHHGSHGDVKLNPDSPFMKVKNLSEALYTEIFVIASGDNYKSPEVSNDVHVNARTIVLLSQNLSYMIMIYPMFFNATTTLALNGALVDGEQTMTILINDLAAQIRRSTFDAVKNNVTDSFIARGKYFKKGATPQEQVEAYDKWLRDPFVGAAAMNKLFFRAVQQKDDKPHYKLLRAMLNYVIHVNIISLKRADDKAQKIQNIYTAVIAKTVQAVCPAHEPHKAAIVFYENLMELLSEDAELLVKLYADQEMTPGMLYDDKPF